MEVNLLTGEEPRWITQNIVIYTRNLFMTELLTATCVLPDKMCLIWEQAQEYYHEIYK